MRPKNVQQLYDQVAKKYCKNRPKAPNDVTELPAMIKLAGNVKGKNVLDVGCGIGKHSKQFIQKGAIVTGIDASKEMLNIAKKTCNNKGTFLVTYVENAKFPKESFDLIIASLSLHYSNQTSHIFKQFQKWLKPNGRIIFSIFHPIQYFRKIPNFDFSKSKKYWFHLNSYDIDVFNYYHPIGKYHEAYSKNGFQLKSLTETTIPKNIKGWPDRNYKIPNTIIFELANK